MIRTRFAPSPTGYLHIGGVRTALFSYLYAQNQKGQFFLRIEDTDQERSKLEFESDILDSLKWLGFSWEDSVPRQSARSERYREIVETLLEKDLAYEENKDGKKAVRFRMPKEVVRVFDIVRGEVTFDTALFDDLVILKSDGFPTYHLACVVDDHDMEMTHVIRGEDHLANTPRQILLFNALGWKPPKYAHLPLILGDDGTPLSKRHMKVSLTEYRQEGYLPEALLNYLALLGWGAAGNQELFTLKELIEKFSLKKVTKAAARFNKEKLDWLNSEHLKRLSDLTYVQTLAEHYPEAPKTYGTERWSKFTLLYKTRLKNLHDLRCQASYFFEPIQSYDAELLNKYSGNQSLNQQLKVLVERLAVLNSFKKEQEIETIIRTYADETSLHPKEYIHLLRFILTGKTVSPGLFEVMSVLGKDRCLKQIEVFLNQVGG